MAVISAAEEFLRRFEEALGLAKGRVVVTGAIGPEGFVSLRVRLAGTAAGEGIVIWGDDRGRHDGLPDSFSFAGEGQQKPLAEFCQELGRRLGL
jgi:hypothetical protein